MGLTFVLGGFILLDTSMLLNNCSSLCRLWISKLYYPLGGTKFISA